MRTSKRSITSVMALAIATSAAFGVSACGHDSSAAQGVTGTTATATARSTVPGQVLVERFNQVKSCGPSIGFDGRAVEDQIHDYLPQLSDTVDRLAEVTPRGDAAFLDHEVDQIAYYRNLVWTQMVVGVHNHDPNMDILLQAQSDSWKQFLDHTVVELKRGKDMPDESLDGLYPNLDHPCAS